MVTDGFMQKYSASKNEEIPLSILIKHTAPSTLCYAIIFLKKFIYIYRIVIYHLCNMWISSVWDYTIDLISHCLCFL